jgi:hypothetical protein
VSGADVGVVGDGEAAGQLARCDEVVVHAGDRRSGKLRLRSKRLAAVVAPV